jgi:hypothetical protein
VKTRIYTVEALFRSQINKQQLPGDGVKPKAVVNGDAKEAS